jgi:hypothetical protein
MVVYSSKRSIVPIAIHRSIDVAVLVLTLAPPPVQALYIAGKERFAELVIHQVVLFAKPYAKIFASFRSAYVE